MFYRFIDKGNGKDEKGRTSREALIDHLNWCYDLLTCRLDGEYEDEEQLEFLKHNALGDMKIFRAFGTLQKLGTSEEKEWNAKTAAVLEYYMKKPINEIDEFLEKKDC